MLPQLPAVVIVVAMVVVVVVTEVTAAHPEALVVTAAAAPRVLTAEAQAETEVQEVVTALASQSPRLPAAPTASPLKPRWCLVPPVASAPPFPRWAALSTISSVNAVLPTNSLSLHLFCPVSRPPVRLRTYPRSLRQLLQSALAQAMEPEVRSLHLLLATRHKAARL